MPYSLLGSGSLIGGKVLRAKVENLTDFRGSSSIEVLVLVCLFAIGPLYYYERPSPQYTVRIVGDFCDSLSSPSVIVTPTKSSYSYKPWRSQYTVRIVGDFCDSLSSPSVIITPIEDSDDECPDTHHSEYPHPKDEVGCWL